MLGLPAEQQIQCFNTFQVGLKMAEKQSYSSSKELSIEKDLGVSIHDTFSVLQSDKGGEYLTPGMQQQLRIRGIMHRPTSISW